MPTHASAEKRVRQNAKRRMRNKNIRTRMTSSARRFEDILASGDLEAAKSAAVELESMYNRGVSKGIIPQARASRKISRINQRLNQALANA